MRLNLACGTDIRLGWLNLDVVPKWPSAIAQCDKVWDARTDRIPCDDGQATEIYAGYLLLHLAPEYHDGVLREIRRVSNKETHIVFGEVDMQMVMERFLKTPLDQRLRELIWGEMGNFHGREFDEYDKHRCGFTEDSLKATLTSYGFGSFSRLQIHHPDVWWELTLSCRKE